MNIKKNKIYIFGATGMIGHMLVKYYKSLRLNVVPITKKELEVDCSLVELQNRINSLNIPKGSTIINAIGSIPQHKPDKKVLWNVNTFFPKTLEEFCNQRGVNLIHISTNHVFDVSTIYISRDGFTELSEARPISDYGSSKISGEPKSQYTIRGCFVGPELIGRSYNLFSWLLNNKDPKVKGYLNAYFNPVTTLELAKFLLSFEWNTTKLVHLYSPHILSKYSFLKEVKELFNLQFDIEPVLSRVEYAVLSSNVIRPLITLPDQLKELKEFYYA